MRPKGDPRAPRHPGPQRPRPVRALGYVVYSIGTIVCLVLMVGVLDRLAHGAPWLEATVLVGILIPWWITAG